MDIFHAAKNRYLSLAFHYYIKDWIIHANYVGKIITFSKCDELLRVEYYY